MSQLKGLAKGLGRVVAQGMAEPDRDEQADKPNQANAKKPTAAKPLTKSKDPAWKAYSLFLKKETHAKMNFLLRSKDTGEDMSDLVQQLVEAWVAKNS